MIIVPNAGERELLKRIFGQGIDASGILKLGLFDENIDITDFSVLSDFTSKEINANSGESAVDASDGELTYERKDLTDSSWTISSSSDGIASYAQVTFTLDGGDLGYNVYGYFVMVDDGVGNEEILWAEKFSSALAISSNAGGEISITLKLELD